MVGPLFKHNASNFQELRASAVCTIAFQITHDRNNSWIKPTLSQISDIYLISTWLQLQASCHIFGKIISTRKSVSLVTWKGHFCCVSVGFHRCWDSGIISTVNRSRFDSRKTGVTTLQTFCHQEKAVQKNRRERRTILGKYLSLRVCTFLQGVHALQQIHYVTRDNIKYWNHCFFASNLPAIYHKGCL